MIVKTDFTGIFDASGVFFPEDSGRTTGAVMMSFTEKTRRVGLLSLEDDIEQLDSGIMKRVLHLIIDGTDPEIVKSTGMIIMNRIIYDLGELLSCAAFVLLESGETGFNEGFDLYVNSRNTGPYRPLVYSIRDELVSMRASLPGKEEMPRRYYDLISLMNSGIAKHEKKGLVENHMMSIIKNNSVFNEMILAGALSIQSGDSPRVLQERLAGYAGIKAWEENPQEK